MNKFLVFALPVAAIGLLFSCSSDVESPEQVLEQKGSSSSGGSSQGGLVLCDFGGGVCAEISAGLCFEHGNAVESCPGTGNSSSAQPVSSSSGLPSGPVLCEVSGICTELSGEVCALLGGTAVQSCPASSSSAVLPSSSSSAPPSSSGVVPSSSSVGLSSSSVLPSSSGVVPSSSSGGQSSSSALPSSSSIGGGSSSSGAPLSGNSFTDSRDGKTYKKVTIGSQTWMGENLNYNASGSKCYNNLDSNCEIYGRLYNWETAKAACPSGWHLPTQTEWDVMTAYIGGSSGAGSKLKATSGWNNRADGTSGNGTDEYGFSALPGGLGFSDGSFNTVGFDGFWWSATEDFSDGAYGRGVYYYLSYVDRGYDGVSYLFSVRCVQD